jgi:D-lactate dehydrogenase
MAEARPLAVFFEVQDWERAAVEACLPDVEIRFSPEPLGPDTIALARDAVVVSGFIRSRIGPAELAALPRLRFVATRSTGYDHIDLAACGARGVAVANVPTYGENTVAEHTFALILTLSRQIHRAVQRTATGDFSPHGLMGFDLKDKTLGVVGAGNIGLHVVRIARGFGMDVLVHDVREQPLLAEVLGFSYVALDELLARADVVTLHVPALPSTLHLLDRAGLGRMKRGALLVNTARGSVVDTEALLWALDEGILAGVGLDVLEGEEYLAEEIALLRAPHLQETLRSLVYGHALLRRPEVIYTPHIAFNSREALARIVDTTVGNVRAFLAGAPRNLVGRQIPERSIQK